MTAFAFATATEILFGRGQADGAPGRIAAMGRRVLLVHGRDAGRSAGLRAGLRAEGCAIAGFPVEAEPDMALIDAGVDAGRGVDVVVAMGGGAVIEIADNGRGIDRARQSLIFEKFSRLNDPARAGGAGLGLAICREIMTVLGGDIAYLPGQGGAAFRIVLPPHPAAAGRSVGTAGSP